MPVGKMDYLSWLQTFLVFLILNDTAKTKLAILASLYQGEGEIVKNSNKVSDWATISPHHLSFTLVSLDQGQPYPE